MKSAVWSLYLVAGVLVSASMTTEAAAQSPQRMMAECRSRASEALRVRLPNVETKYEGQRSDGTHAVNGTAYIRQQERTFQCSFNSSGQRIIRFVVNRTPATQLPSGPIEPGTRTERVSFFLGVTKRTRNGSLVPGASVRYLVKGRNLQFLTVQLEARSARTSYNIFTPSGSLLFESAKGGRFYRGQLYQTGDHVIEVANRGQGNSSYTIVLTLKNR
jgi:hypothetical protein